LAGAGDQLAGVLAGPIQGRDAFDSSLVFVATSAERALSSTCFRTRRRIMRPVNPLKSSERLRLTVISQNPGPRAVAEVLGAIGLVVPMAIGIAPILTRVAAVCLATLMGGAAATHAMRGESAAVSTILAVLVIAVAAFR
jgi:hypothetical protein